MLRTSPGILARIFTRNNVCERKLILQITKWIKPCYVILYIFVSTSHPFEIDFNIFVSIKCYQKCGADYILMELDESTNPFTCNDIDNFHKLAQENGAVFTTKSFVVSDIMEYTIITVYYYNLYIRSFRIQFVKFLPYNSLRT